MHQHVKQPFIARAGHHLETIRTQNIHIQPAQTKPITKFFQLFEAMDRGKPRGILLANQKYAIANQIFIDWDTNRHQFFFQCRIGIQVHDSQFTAGTDQFLLLSPLAHHLRLEHLVGTIFRHGLVQSGLQYFPLIAVATVLRRFRGIIDISHHRVSHSA